MSNRPTLWVVHQFDKRRRETMVLERPASRADLLAALDVEWYCARPKDAIGYVCTDYRPCGSECHWAVKR